MIIPTWKQLGASTHQLAKNVGLETASKTNNIADKKATHTGTLDPMAEGVVVVLTGQDRFKKGTFKDWKKTYSFEIMFGVSTDSLDLLGLQTNLAQQTITSSKIKKELLNILPTFIGKQTQTQPNFSSQRIEGKSGFDLAKKNINFTQKENSIDIFSLELINTKDADITKLTDKILSKIQTVTGNFRQDEITTNWNQTLKTLQQQHIKTLPIFQFTATVSKRTYIRSLVQDISQKLGISATTYSIIRIQEGPYSKNDCV